jgi:hypothetical protein
MVRRSPSIGSSRDDRRNAPEPNRTRPPRYSLDRSTPLSLSLHRRLRLPVYIVGVLVSGVILLIQWATPIAKPAA